MSYRTVEQQAAMQSGKNDVWGQRRTTDPVLRAVINVLCAHTEVGYYVVDWRPFLFGGTCPAEEDGLARTPAIFNAIDAEVARQRAVQENRAVEARGGQLDLFASA